MNGRFETPDGGLIELREEGRRLSCFVRRAADGAGLYKAWLFGGGKEFLLGTLLPEGSFLRLERTVSRDELERRGCWPISGGTIRLVHSFSGGEANSPPLWKWEHRPGNLITDEVLAQSAGNWGSMLLRNTQNGFYLAAPLDHRHPFPLTALFCLAQPVRIDGQPHVCFFFDSRGKPAFPAHESI